MTVEPYEPGGKLSYSNLTGGKRKRGNGHKANCGCPICKNMKKGKRGGVLLVGGAMCPDGVTDDMGDPKNCPAVAPLPTTEGDASTGGSRRRRRSSASKSRRKSRSKSRNGGRKKSKRRRR